VNGTVVPSVYLDACCLIYLVEGEPAWKKAVEQTLHALGAAGSAGFITSELSRLECRTKPLRDRNEVLLSRYDELLEAERLQLLTVSRAVIDQATELRARYGLKAPDSIHIATAVVAGADVFLTGDGELARCTEIRVKVLAAAP
jgi:predicted nucleic acid-binding protein